MAITLKAARVNAGLTQTEAADRLDVSLDTVRRIESGKSSPKTDLLLRMLGLYCVDFNDVILPSKPI